MFKIFFDRAIAGLAILFYTEQNLWKYFQNGAVYRKCGNAVGLYSLARIIFLRCFLFWTTEA